MRSGEAQQKKKPENRWDLYWNGKALECQSSKASIGLIILCRACIFSLFFFSTHSTSNIKKRARPEEAPRVLDFCAFSDFQ